MRITTLYLTTIAFFTFFISCQKESSSSSSSSSKNKIKSYTEDVTSSVLGHYVETFNIAYDNNDRVVSVTSATTPGNKFVYQYPGGTQYTMDIYEANAITLHVTNFINSSLSLVDSSFQYNDTQDSSTQKFIYNANKQLIKEYDYDYSKSTGSVLSDINDFTYDNNGNCIKEKNSNTETSLKYDTIIPNTLYAGLIYLPMDKQLPTSESTVGGSTINHTYTFDSDKRVISDKAVYSTGDVVIRSYTYF